eukprot:15423084-Heterocapsa_arctica.AAC.1
MEKRWRPAPEFPSVTACIHLPLSKCGLTPCGKICLTFLGCLTITPTPPLFWPPQVEGMAGANTASKPCPVAAPLAPLTCFLDSRVSWRRRASSSSWTAHSSPE